MCSQSKNQNQDGSKTDLKSLTWAALWMTPHFSGQLASLWATWFFSTLPFVFYSVLALLVSVVSLSPPLTVSRQGQNAAEQQTQIVAINFRLVYGLGLLAHLLVNSCNRHYCPLLEHRTTRPQLHPAHPLQPALWTTSMGLHSFYSYTTAVYHSVLPPCPIPWFTTTFDLTFLISLLPVWFQYLGQSCLAADIK